MTDSDMQIAKAMSMSAEEIIETNTHFTDPKAQLISVNKVAKKGVRDCNRLLRMFDEDDKKPWWKFWG